MKTFIGMILWCTNVLASISRFSKEANISGLNGAHHLPLLLAQVG